MIEDRVSSWHIKVAAEGFAAGLFARCGLDVSVQYGADQPEYDLIVAKRDKLLKVSVKGSQDGSWGLTQSYLQNADYHSAINTWLERHGQKTILCFIQFMGVPIDGLPRAYVATPCEVAQRLYDTCKGRGDTILYEEHHWGPRAYSAGVVEKIPENWRFSRIRVDQLLDEA